MKAMIFAAGLGTRFKPWTDKHPKALALVNGKSLLQRNVEYLQQFGIRDIVVNVHHFAGQLVEEIKKYNGWGSKILISDERDELLETGGGLLKAMPFFTKGERFMTCNADILTNLDITKLISFHEKHQPLITMAVMDRKTSRYLLFDEQNRLCGWRNTKTGEERMSIPKASLQEKAYSCVVLFEYEIFSLIRQKGKFSIIETYLDLAADHVILGYDHSGDKLADVGKPESVPIAESLFP
ncbi:MAG TPA: sugar phosphate nucleotidyltransferase [Chitinophagaceae bacterium]|jgi:NDP-sugar pyrophosphorylase family protein|nr:sugar phosphate nucleotidyltransferase [Chitinophagaceae bacterium]